MFSTNLITFTTAKLAALFLFAVSPALCQEAVNPWPPQPLPGIVLRGSEHSGRFVQDNPGWPPHLVTLFLTEKNIDSSWQTPRQHLEWASSPLHSYVADGTGCFVIIAHPPASSFEEIMSLPALNAMEVNHSGHASKYEELWDRVLTARLRGGQKPLWGTGADDTHWSAVPKIPLSWIALRMPELSEAAVKRALRAGAFYVSNGPVITDVQVRGATIEVTAAGPVDIRWVRDGQFGIGPAVVSPGPGENHCLRIDRGVSRSSYTLPDAAGAAPPLFLRCLVTTAKPEKAAQTQPFVVAPGGSLANPYPSSGRWHRGMTHNHGDYPEGSEARATKYFELYASRGFSAAFETPYEYWFSPMATFPEGRAPRIARVEPHRVPAGAAATLRVSGSGFSPKARLLLDGREQRDVRQLAGGSLECRLSAAPGPGPHELTVVNPDGLQGTLQRALVVQTPDADNRGWSQFTPFNAELGSLHTLAVGPDPRGGIWVGTAYGISHFDGSRWTLHRDSGQGALDNFIYDVAADPDGNEWFTSVRGVGVLHPDGKLTQHTREAGFFNAVNQVLRDGDVTYVTMHMVKGLFALRDGKWSQVTVPGRAPVNGIVRAPDGVFWLGTSEGLLQWDGGAKWQEFTTANSGLPDNYIRRVACDRAGALWVATATRSENPVGGLARFYHGTWTVYDTSNSPLPERRVWDVYPDSRGRVWVATSRGVACLLPRGEWRVYDMAHSGLSDDMVTGIAEDRAGNQWFATAYGVSRFTPPGP